MSLRDRIASLDADVVSYRALAQQAIHELHAAQVAKKHADEAHLRLMDEYRRLRERTMTGAN